MPSLERLDRLAGELEAAAPDLQQVHLLRHTVALHQNDHTTAVEALHRYFDYRPASRTRAPLLDIAVSTLLHASTDTWQHSTYKGFALYTKCAYRRSHVTAQMSGDSLSAANSLRLLSCLLASCRAVCSK